MLPFFADLAAACSRAEATAEHNAVTVPLDEALLRAVRMARFARSNMSRVFFVGNGGSAAIASHCAADWTKNGGFASLAFNEPAQLTCISNDLGYGEVFALPLHRLGRAGDMLFAISSSGASQSILRACDAAHQAVMRVVTLSGFGPDNPLRKRGHLNFWIPSTSYGVVETAHLGLLHAILERASESA